MTDTSVRTQSTIFKIGLGILLFFALGNVLGHIGLLIFDQGGDVVFLAWASFNLMAATILLFPYRRNEPWAWYAIWGMVIPYALIIAFNGEVGPIYLGEAILLAVGQIITYGTFFGRERIA
jgi:hypothetical protein